MMELNSNNYGVVLVTVGTKEAGKAIAQSLVQAKLAACVNILPIDSIYLWQGEINQDCEYQLIIKTDLDKFDELSHKIKTLHTYEVPEIIALPIVAGAKSYLDWLGNCLQP